CMNPAVCRARSNSHHRPCFRRKAVDPLADGYRLIGIFVGAESRPVTFGLVFLVRNRAFGDQQEGIDLASGRAMKDLQEIISDFVVEERIVKVDSWDSRNGPSTTSSMLGCI